MKLRRPSASYIAKQIARLQSENKRLLSDNVDILYEAVDAINQSILSEKYQKNSKAIEYNHKEILRLKSML